MKYTKAQRHRIYKNALGIIPIKHWLCWALSEGNGLADIEDFPEVLAQKPKRFYFNLDGVVYWFSCDKRGINKRLAILRKAIQLTKPKTTRKLERSQK